MGRSAVPRSAVPVETRRWRTAIVVAFALGGFALSSWGTRLPRIREQLGVDDAGLGVLLLCGTIGSAVGLVASNAVSARLGSRRAILATLVGAAAGLVAIGVASGLGSVPLAVVGLALAGLGVGATDILINVDGAEVEQRVGRSLLPFMHAAWPGGAVLGAGLGAASGALGIEPVLQLGVQGALIAVIGLLLTRWIPARDAAAAAASPRAPFRERVRRILRALRDARLLLIGLVMLGAELGEGAANGWLSIASHEALGQTQSTAAALFGVYAAAQCLVRLATGPLVNRFGRAPVVRVTTLLGVVGVIVFIAGLGLPGAIVGAALWSIGVSAGFPLGISAAAEGDDPGTRITLVAGFGYAASFVGPPLIGLLAQGFGILNALWPVALLFAVSVFVAGAFGGRPGADRRVSDERYADA